MARIAALRTSHPRASGDPVINAIKGAPQWGNVGSHRCVYHDTVSGYWVPACAGMTYGEAGHA